MKLDWNTVNAEAEKHGLFIKTQNSYHVVASPRGGGAYQTVYEGDGTLKVAYAYLRGLSDGITQTERAAQAEQTV